MIGESLLRYNRTQVYCVLDFETESLNTYYSRPWQASWMLFNLDGIIEQHDNYVLWEDLNISKDAAAKTQFNPELYCSKARPAQEVLSEFEQVVYNPEIKLVGHNILPFDTLIHQVLRKSLGLPPDFSYLPRCIDTLALARAYRKGIAPVTSSPEEFLAWQYRMLTITERNMKCGLGALGKEFKIEHDERGLHNSANDITLNAGIFRELILKMDV